MNHQSAVALFLLAVLIATACSSSHRLAKEDLKHSASELSSLSAEGHLFLEFVRSGHATAEYASTYPEYLKEQSATALAKLAEAHTAADTQGQLEQLRTAAQRLDQAVGSLRLSNPMASMHADFAAIDGELKRTGLLQ
jgi:hypothetical protein